MKKWPNLYLVGAAKCGTTSLHDHLSKIPHICMSHEKEPHFFSASYIRNLKYPGMCESEQAYLNMFDYHLDDTILGESSTSYLPFKDAAVNISKVSPNAKIIISLRDPVERAFSHYLMVRRAGHTQLTFEDEVKKELNELNDKNIGFLHLYHYSDQVKNYMDIFGKENVMVLIFESWIKDTDSTINKIINFLEVKVNKEIKPVNKKHNSYYERHSFALMLMKIPFLSEAVRLLIPVSLRAFINKTFLSVDAEKPVMSNTAIKMLQEYYREDITKLKNILDTELPWEYFTNKDRAGS
ncbi:MAG: sulfotransferase domain-containing protein [Methylococcales bacterium]